MSAEKSVSGRAGPPDRRAPETTSAQEIQVQPQQPLVASEEEEGDAVLFARSNGRCRMRTSAVLASLSALTLCVLTGAMMRKQGAPPLENEYSEALIAFTIVLLLSVLSQHYDTHSVFKGTPDSFTALPWQWQHASFKRIALLLHIHLICLFPVVVTFLFQSMGTRFFDAVDNLTGSDETEYEFHIASFAFLVATILAHFALAYISLHKLHVQEEQQGGVVVAHQAARVAKGTGGGRRSRRNSEAAMAIARAGQAAVESQLHFVGRSNMAVIGSLPPMLASRSAQGASSLQLMGSSSKELHGANGRRQGRRGEKRRSNSRKFVCFTKLLAIATMAATIMFAFSIIRAVSKEVNSGIVISVIIYMMVAVAVVLDQLRWLIRSEDRTSEFIMRSRNTIAVLGFVSFIVFWVVLVLLVLDRALGKDFWGAVDDLGSSGSVSDGKARANLIYSYIALFFVYTVLAVYRIYLHKLRRTLRKERLWRLGTAAIERSWAKARAIANMARFPETGGKRRTTVEMFSEDTLNDEGGKRSVMVVGPGDVVEKPPATVTTAIHVEMSPKAASAEHGHDEEVEI